jgi:hypothetical protein
MRAFSGEADGHRLAHSRSGAGDECYLALK